MHLELTKEQYEELTELVFLGEFLKTGNDVMPFEQMLNRPSTKLQNYILSQADNFDCKHLVEHSPQLGEMKVLSKSDELIEKYFDFD